MDGGFCPHSTPAVIRIAETILLINTYNFFIRLCLLFLYRVNASPTMKGDHDHQSCVGSSSVSCTTSATAAGGGGSMALGAATSEDGEPPRCSLLDIQVCPVSASVASLPFCESQQPRRHGRFLVQPIAASPLQSSSMSSRSASPGASRANLKSSAAAASAASISSPSQPCGTNFSVVSERRPSRIIGRFEVSELLPLVKSTNVIIQELSTASTSGDTTPMKVCIRRDEQDNFPTL